MALSLCQVEVIQVPLGGGGLYAPVKFLESQDLFAWLVGLRSLALFSKCPLPVGLERGQCPLRPSAHGELSPDGPWSPCAALSSSTGLWEKYSPLFQVFVGGVGDKVVPKMLGHGSN